jgi:hypothetical protein
MRDKEDKMSADAPTARDIACFFIVLLAADAMDYIEGRLRHAFDN